MADCLFISAESITKFSNYTNMRGIEFHIKAAADFLRKQGSLEARRKAENLDYCLFCLEAMYPDCFPGLYGSGLHPAAFCRPIFAASEREIEEAR